MKPTFSASKFSAPLCSINLVELRVILESIYADGAAPARSPRPSVSSRCIGMTDSEAKLSDFLSVEVWILAG
jgi:hypothetical protein